MKHKSKEVWLEQMHVFPDTEGVYEHDVPYVVEFETSSGKTRTRELTQDEAKEVRAFNKIAVEQIVSGDENG